MNDNRQPKPDHFRSYRISCVECVFYITNHDGYAWSTDWSSAHCRRYQVEFSELFQTIGSDATHSSCHDFYPREEQP